MSERIDAVALVAALVEGDRWLSADSAAAYRRGHLLTKRRELMQAWADYCGG